MNKILEEVGPSDTIAITGHERPDGDCIGACMGLYLYLLKALPDASVDLYLEKPAPAFANVPRIDEIKTACDADLCYDVCIVVDSAADRIGGARKYFDTAKKTINIDHHISNASGCGKINYINPKASSASELVYELMDEDRIDVQTELALGFM